MKIWTVFALFVSLCFTKALIPTSHLIAPSRRSVPHDGCNRFNQRFWSRPSHRLYSREVMLAEAMTKRNSVLKQELNELCVNSRGVFDKPELAALLVDKKIVMSNSQSSSDSSSSPQNSIVVPMLDVVSSNVPGAKSYVGIELECQGQNIRCMIDTAASTNLIKPEVSKRLGLIKADFNQYSSGLGGSSQIADGRTIMQSLKFARSTTNIPAINCAVLTNGAAIPPSVDCLLGLPFLENLQSLVTLDLVKKVFKFSQGVMPSDEQEQYHRIPIRKVYPTGLIVCDAMIDENGKTVTALVDLGATYSILSSRAVQSILGKNMETLNNSNTVSAGIDGRPMYMKEVSFDSLKLGGMMNVGGMKIYAADIPQLEAIGLGQGMLLIGLDVLSKYDSISFCFKEMALYLKK